MVLNPVLFRRLQRKFGKDNVLITNEDVEMICHYEKSAFRVGEKARPRLKVKVDGENYRIRCPFCKDHTPRLYISYRWGVEDQTGSPNFWLANCYNEGCLGDPVNRGILREMILSHGIRMGKDVLRPAPAKEDSGESQQLYLPTNCVRLDSLPVSHPARVYLDDRGFDSEKLARFYDVRYCSHSFEFRLASDRIIIPCWSEGVLIGWQARSIGPPQGTLPKYWTCPGTKKRSLLYNYDTAKEYKTVMVCEGPTDVWSFGRDAVALFGKAASSGQREMLRKLMAGKTKVVILLDPDKPTNEKHKQHHIARLYSQLKPFDPGGRLLEVYLPEGKDPGSLNRDFMERVIKQAANKKGIKLYFGRKQQYAKKA